MLQSHKFFLIKLNGYELKHVHHQHKLFLTEKVIVCKINVISGSTMKTVLPNHKNDNNGYAIGQWTEIHLHSVDMRDK